MRNVNQYILSFIFIAFLVACASRMPPTGGPKDTTPPKIISSIPDSAGLNFRGQILNFTFSEFVELKDAGSGIFISPPVKTPPVATLTGKTLKLKFEEPFDSNTTYQLNFSKAIKDLTEGNPIKDEAFIFSTGNIIDSLAFSGTVTDGYTNKPVKDALVMLYEQIKDSVPLKEIPRYFTSSNETGKYLISNIKPGKYKTFALLDGNNNYLFDQVEEKIGFIKNEIIINKKINEGNNFRLFQNPTNTLKLLRKKFISPATVSLKYSKQIDDWNIKWLYPQNGLTAYFEEYQGKDSITVSFSKTELDSIVFISEVKSRELIKIDTFKFEPNKLNKISNKKSGKNKINSDTLIKLTTNLELGKLRLGDTLKITAQSPFQLIEPSKIKLKINKDSIPTKLPIIENGAALKIIKLINTTLSEKNTELLFLPGALEDIYNRKNDTIRFSFSPFEEDDLGTLFFKIKLDSIATPLVFELLDKNQNLIQKKSCKNDDLLIFEKLIPGNYSAQIIIDKNNNYKWDSGSYFLNIQPEFMKYYSGEILIRPSWETELIMNN